MRGLVTQMWERYWQTDLTDAFNLLLTQPEKALEPLTLKQIVHLFGAHPQDTHHDTHCDAHGGGGGGVGVDGHSESAAEAKTSNATGLSPESSESSESQSEWDVPTEVEWEDAVVTLAGLRAPTANFAQVLRANWVDAKRENTSVKYRALDFCALYDGL